MDGSNSTVIAVVCLVCLLVIAAIIVVVIIYLRRRSFNFKTAKIMNDSKLGDYKAQDNLPSSDKKDKNDSEQDLKDYERQKLNE